MYRFPARTDALSEHARTDFGSPREQVVSRFDQPALEALLARLVAEESPKTEAEFIALRISAVAYVRLHHLGRKLANDLDDRIKRGLRALHEKRVNDVIGWRDRLPDPEALAAILKSSHGLGMFAQSWRELAARSYQGPPWSEWEVRRARLMLESRPSAEFEELRARVERGASVVALVGFCLKQARVCEDLAREIAGGPERAEVERVIAEASLDHDGQSQSILRCQKAAERTFERGLKLVRLARQDRERLERALRPSRNGGGRT